MFATTASADARARSERVVSLSSGADRALAPDSVADRVGATPFAGAGEVSFEAFALAFDVDASGVGPDTLSPVCWPVPSDMLPAGPDSIDGVEDDEAAAAELSEADPLELGDCELDPAAVDGVLDSLDACAAEPDCDPAAVLVPLSLEFPPVAIRGSEADCWFGDAPFAASGVVEVEGAALLEDDGAELGPLLEAPLPEPVDDAAGLPAVDEYVPSSASESEVDDEDVVDEFDCWDEADACWLDALGADDFDTAIVGATGETERDMR